jgi:SAM-dependent methyltransferase
MNTFFCKKCKSLTSSRIAAMATCVILFGILTQGCAAKAPADEVARIAELMQLKPGMRVADVGAGDGEWAEALAKIVGTKGHVYATEVKPDLVEDIRDRAEDAGLENVTAILGDGTSPGLDEGCCDAILVRLVYHHFTDPVAMRADLRRALRPGAPLVVIDIVPQTHWGDLPGVPDRGGHGIPLDMFIEEVSADGFEVIEQFKTWPGDDDHFCAVIRAKP